MCDGSCQTPAGRPAARRRRSCRAQVGPLDISLDGAELVRDVEDRRPSSSCSGRQGRERLLRLDVDTRRRLVEDQQGGLGRQRLGDERPLLQSSGERLEVAPPSRSGRHARSPLRRSPGRVLGAARTGRRRRAARRQPLPARWRGHLFRAWFAGPGNRECAVVRNRAPARREKRLPGVRALEAERNAYQRRLAATVRARDGENSPGSMRSRQHAGR